MPSGASVPASSAATSRPTRSPPRSSPGCAGDQAGGRGAAMSQRTLSTETVYRGVKDRILDNTFPPGFQILEQDLAALFAVSRTPVREALVRLGNDGLVDVVPRHGMRVLPLKLSDMQ